MRSLFFSGFGEFQAPPIGLEYELNILETMPRKMEEKKIV